MKVSFLVPTDLMELAEEQVRWYLEEVEGEQCSPCFNKDQNLALAGRVLTYIGQRCPMVQDGALGAILAVFGTTAQATTAVVEYQTSDKRLEWYQTLASYIQDSGSIPEAVGHLIKTGYHPQSYAALRRVPKGTLGSDAKINAAYDAADAAALQKMARHFEMNA